MRLHRETGESIPSAAARGKQWEDVRETGGHREIGGRATGRCRAGNSARRGAGNGGWGNRWEAARERRRRKTDVMAPGRGLAEKSASGDESGSAGKPRDRRGGTEKAAGTLPRGDGAGTPLSRRRGSETGQKGRAAKGERTAAPFGNRPLLFIYLAGPDGPLPVPTGRSTVKAMRPPPLSARMFPPWRCTMSRAMASPSPAPPVAVCREASSR